MAGKFVSARKEVPSRRFGRPPGVDADETRKRLVNAAKGIFAKWGYKEASNKLIAAAAGVTSGAIYHYFPNKQAMFLAVHEELQASTVGGLEPLVEQATDLVSALNAILNNIVENRNGDPDATAFFSVVRTEAKRNPEISAALDDSRWLKLYDDLALLGVKSGQVHPDHFRSVKAVLALVLFGITQHAAETSASGHQAALDGLRLLVRGQLISLPSQDT